MQFIDEAKIKAKGGNGGAGIVAWRREKFVPLGGPFGGNGGKGGDVIFVAKEGLSSLLDLKQHTFYEAKNGSKGQSKNKTGRKGADRILTVPVGTVVRDQLTKQIICDLVKHDQNVVICKGGDGGFGNSHFKSQLCNAPDKATLGQKGEERDVFLTLKLMADVGLLGFPNAGKSTLLARLSNAKPKIADYPFTTIKPTLGVCEVDVAQSMVIADIPGLIKNASLGQGLGFRFLRHLERVRVLCHMIDGSAELDLTTRFLTINEELGRYKISLAEQKQVVAINKIDAIHGNQQQNLIAFKKYLADRNIAFCEISAVTGKGLASLKKLLYDCVANSMPSLNQESRKDFRPAEKLY